MARVPKLQIVVPIFSSVEENPPQDFQPCRYDTVRLYRADVKGKQYDYAYHCYHHARFMRMKNLILPSDVPDIKFYFQMAGIFEANELSILDMPLVNTQKYKSAYQHCSSNRSRYPGPGKKVVSWEGWCEMSIKEVLDKFTYDELNKHIEPFTPFLVDKLHKEFNI